MKIFLDTAETDVVRKHFKTGLIDGLTTNPSLIRKSGRKHEEVYQEFKDIGLKDISMEVIGSKENMISEGLRLHKKFGKVATIKVGAAYVSPFVGRVDDNSFGGLCLIKDIANVYAKQNWTSTEILAASIRNVRDVGRAFEYGANICTIPTKVFEGMYNHILTDAGLKQFDIDYAESIKE